MPTILPRTMDPLDDDEDSSECNNQDNFQENQQDKIIDENSVDAASEDRERDMVGENIESPLPSRNSPAFDKASSDRGNENDVSIITVKEHLEIEQEYPSPNLAPTSQTHPPTSCQHHPNDGNGDDDEEEPWTENDLQHLLSNDKKSVLPASTSVSVSRQSKTQPTSRIGNCYIFAPNIYSRTRWGIAGPHWFGPPIVLGVIAFCTAYFYQESLRRIGYGSALLCIFWGVLTCYNLIQCCYRDPGIVRAASTSMINLDEGARYCDACDQYQPSDGAHCPDCNVCIAGFDHHCVWMGCCIGKGNLKPFVRFNLSWMFYLLYAIVWCSLLGPIIF